MTMVQVPHYSTLQEALQGLKDRGFTENLELDGQSLRAVGTERRFTADKLTIVEHHRFEGASDPDDMSIVYGIEASDGTRGVVVDAFGVYADPRLSEFLKAVKMKEGL
jgi:hypothetical protein